MIRDMKMEICSAIRQDPEITKYVDMRNVKLYQWAEHEEAKYPCIIIVPRGAPRGSEFGSDIELNKEMTYDIHVQGNMDWQVRQVAATITDIMRWLGFVQLPESLDEYIEDIHCYVDVRRYRIKTRLYDTDY